MQTYQNENSWIRLVVTQNFFFDLFLGLKKKKEKKNFQNQNHAQNTLPLNAKLFQIDVVARIFDPDP